MPAQPPPADRRLRPPQFGLRTLLIVVTFFAVLFALAHWLTPIAWVGIALLATSIFLHVAGNAIGTHLRQIGNRLPPEPAAPLIRRPLEAREFAPVTRLGQRRSLGWLIVLATACGVLCGATGGGVWTWLSSRQPAGALEIAVGAVAFAVLGGLAAFAAFAFTQVLLGAFWQALHPPP